MVSLDVFWLYGTMINADTVYGDPIIRCLKRNAPLLAMLDGLGNTV